jgi:hypothetical protein
MKSVVETVAATCDGICAHRFIRDECYGGRAERRPGGIHLPTFQLG